jgi:non-heme chloroperoxidase
MSIKVKQSELPHGVTLQYAEQGEKSGIPILFLHGLSDSWHSFERVLPNLPESFHAFALTLRGHGDSSRPEEGYRFRDFAADVEAFMDLKNIDSAVIVAHSMGCLVAQLFAVEYPERVKGLILIGSPYRPSEKQDLKEMGEFILSSLEDPVPSEFVREFQESTLVQPVPEDFLETIIEESLKLPARVWKAVVESFMQEDLSGELNKIKAPTLLVWGDKDGMFGKSDQDKQLAVIENSKLLIHEGAGHGVHWEEPEKFTSGLLNFIKDDLA